jgi:hypothetical protein
VITSYSHDFNFRLRKRQEGFKLNSPATKEVGWRRSRANKNETAAMATSAYIGERRALCAVAIARLYANKCLLNSWNENECPRLLLVVLFIMKEVPAGCIPFASSFVAPRVRSFQDQTFSSERECPQSVHEIIWDLHSFA